MYFPNLVLEEGPIGSQVYHAIRKGFRWAFIVYQVVIGMICNSAYTGFERLIDEGFIYRSVGTFVVIILILFRIIDPINPFNQQSKAH